MPFRPKSSLITAANSSLGAGATTSSHPGAEATPSNLTFSQDFTPFGGDLNPISFVSQVGVTNVNPGATTYASASKVTSSGGDILFTKTTAHGYAFGLIVQFSTSTTLPTGISALTDYFVVPITTLTFKIADSLAHAQAGTYIAYADTGTGTQTATPTALAGCTLKLQGSGDGTNWVDIPNSTLTITTTATLAPFEEDYTRYPLYRHYLTITTGQVSFSPLLFSFKTGG